jgi:hypothetical protein
LFLRACDRSVFISNSYFKKRPALLGYGSAEDLGAEEAALGALDDLLVDAHGRVVHDDGAGLVVDLGVDAGVADQVDDPLLALVLAEAEAGGEVPVKMIISSCSKLA